MTNTDVRSANPTADVVSKTRSKSSSPTKAGARSTTRCGTSPETPYLDGEPSVLLNQVRSELKRIYEGIEDVRRQIRTSDEAVSRLVRQQTDTSYRTMLAKLNQLFAKTSAEAKAHPNDQSRPYHTDAGQAKFPTLPSRPARSMARAASST